MARFFGSSPREARLVSRSPQAGRPFMGRREIISVLLITSALAVILFSIGPDSCAPQAVENPGDPGLIGEMPYPDLSALPNLPAWSAVTAAEERAREFLRNPERIFGQSEDVVVAWARLQLDRDRNNPPLPLRVTADDLRQAHASSRYRIRNGARVAISGQLLERHPASPEDADEDWYRLLIAAGPGAYFQALVRGEAAQIDTGSEVTLLGRYLGMYPAPVHPDILEEVDLESVQLLTVASQQIRRREERQTTTVTSLLGLGVPDAPGTGAFRHDPEIFDDVDDNALRMERRAYYYLLGQVLLDRTSPGVYDDPADAHLMEEALHHHAPEYRGKVFSVSGRVLRAWEDGDVAPDNPFGAQRVIRLWMWAFIPEKKTITVDGEEREIVTTQLGVYELAAVVNDDRPLPQPGDHISAVGRFFKVQRYQRSQDFIFNRGSLANPDRALSDSVYFKVFISNDYDLTPPDEPISILALKIGFLVFFSVFLAIFVRMIDLDHRSMDNYKKPVRRLRKKRRALFSAARQQQAQETEEDEQEEGQTDDMQPTETEDEALSNDNTDDEQQSV